MRLFGFLPVVARRSVVALGVAGMMLTMAPAAFAQDPAQQAPAQPAAPDPFKFAQGSPAIVMIQVKPGNETTLESAVSAVKSKMAASEKPEVQAQAQTINLMKLNVPIPDGQPAVYIIYIESPTGASYNIEAILGEIGEWRQDSEIYKQFSSAIAQWAPWPLVRK
jgi:hypothetical protein